MFIPPKLVEQCRVNVQRWPWAAAAQRHIVEAAAPWLAMSDDHLWGLMFGPTITRSWMVWSNGHCPACQVGVPMYNWKIDGVGLPWKTTCPHCKEVFPKNDFAAFYRSGLDSRAVFDPAKADRSLLFNVEHPDPADPLRGFGVDDGEGYVADGKRWRFIGTFIIYGQWKQAIVAGTRALAAAYVVSGDARYAHKAGILLDRVADLYPGFDHSQQAWVYENVRTEGYVSTWHDACEETREMALAYDYVRPALLEDRGLATFLAARAKALGLANPKATPADVCRNIEAGLLRDPLKNRQRIHSNYPRREIALATIHRVLDTPEDRKAFDAIVIEMLKKATAVDGVTGEKGLAAYSSYVIHALAHFLAQLERLEPGSTARLLKQCPSLAKTYRFHIDTWVDQRFYPRIGDDGVFGDAVKRYVAAHFGGQSAERASVEPSIYEFFWALYKATGDEAYVQILHGANEGKVDDLPLDLFAADPEGFRKEVAAVIAKHGTVPRIGSVDFKQWRLAILRGGAVPHTRTLWLNYDRGGGHGHNDGLNLGLFAKGLDLMPDMGYPPVQFGGWGSPRALWYRKTAAHNTVVIDGKDQPGNWHDSVGGTTSVWADGKQFRAVAAGGVQIARENVLNKRIPLSGPEHELVSIYSWTGGTFERFTVWTRPEDCDPSTPWSKVFSDDFSRAELGPDWSVAEGSWRIEGGKLVGRGQLVCTRRFAERQRVEVVASSNDPKPVDLSLGLAGNKLPVADGVFFAFGTADGKQSLIRWKGQVLSKGVGQIRTGQRHTIEALRDGELLALRVDGAEIGQFINNDASVQSFTRATTDGWQYHRTGAMIDVSDRDAYLLDVFHVAGGADHAKFQHMSFGSLKTQGLSLRASEDFGDDTQMRGFQTDAAPPVGWSAEFTVEDRYKLQPPGSQVRVNYTDLTRGAQASTCEAWVMQGTYNSSIEAWIPRLMVRRKSEGGKPLASTFVAVVEPHEGVSAIASIRRLALATPDGRAYGDAHVAAEIALRDGRVDLLLLAGDENPLKSTPWPAQDGGLVQPERAVKFVGRLAWLRVDASGRPLRLALANATSLECPGLSVRLCPGTAFAEIDLSGKAPVVVTAEAGGVEAIKFDPGVKRED
ncbi:MAG: heparinase II/III family protein [Planctomycetota bacterium]|nr:heparinase II/III family protein [Planctomycetota bacterium]